MPLHPGHSDEVKDKNIKEMIEAGHEPKQAVAAAYANQRKYRKMAMGGMIPKDDMTEESIAADINDEHERGLFELQQASHLDEQLDVPTEHSEVLAKALAERENLGMATQEEGHAGSDATYENIVALPASHFAEEAKKAIEKRKKAKMIDNS